MSSNFRYARLIYDGAQFNGYSYLIPKPGRHIYIHMHGGLTLHGEDIWCSMERIFDVAQRDICHLQIRRVRGGSRICKSIRWLIAWHLIWFRSRRRVHAEAHRLELKQRWRSIEHPLQIQTNPSSWLEITSKSSLRKSIMTKTLYQLR